MPYADPKTVISPKTIWELEEVLINTGQGGWSAARGWWDGTSVLGIRRNGSDGESGYGSPQSRGYPTWLIIPDELKSVVEREIKRLGKTMGIVTCTITHPEDYTLGAWEVKAEVGPELLHRLGNSPLVFLMPSLPSRLCHPDKDYLRTVDGELRGCFIDGKWHGNLYSNGVPESENLTSIDAFRDAFVQNVMRASEQMGLLAGL